MTQITKKLLIQAQTVYTITGLNKEIDEGILNPSILTAQELQIEPKLGTKLYQALLNGSYASFKENFVYQALCWFAVVEGLPLIYNRIGNGGVFNNSNANAQVVPITNYANMLQWANGKATTYSDRMMKQIEFKRVDFPEYDENENEDVKPIKSSMRYGIRL